MKKEKNFFKIFQKLKKPEKQIEKNFNRYEEGKREYLDAHMNMAVALHSWKLTALGSLAIAFISVIIVFYLATRSSLIPYVIEVDSITGNAKGINVAMQKTYDVKEMDKEYHLREFLKRYRNVSNDVYVVNNFYLTNTYYLTPAARKKYDRTIKEENIPQLFKEGFTRQIDISSINKLATNSLKVSSYQVRWKERTFDETGELVKEKRYSGIFTLEIEPAQNIESLTANPLGIKVRDFSLSFDN